MFRDRLWRWLHVLGSSALALGFTGTPPQEAPQFCGTDDFNAGGYASSPRFLSQAVFEDAVVPGRTAVIDILFVYSRSTERHWGGDLQERVRQMVDGASIAMLNSGANARLRLVGVERGPAILEEYERDAYNPPHFLALARASRWARESAEARELRERHGADLTYVLIEGYAGERFPGICGLARFAGEPASMTAAFTGAINTRDIGCPSLAATLAHEVGHNLGLVHERGNAGGPPMRPGGRGFLGEDSLGRKYGTIMAVGSRDQTVAFRKSLRYSTSKSHHNGRVIGTPGEHEAVDALRFAAPFAAALKRSKYADGAGSCDEGPAAACLVGGRFTVTADYVLPSGESKGALVREAYLGDSATLFYFFSADNPEMLIKVIDGCGRNDHYWVFGSAATDLEYKVEIADREGGVARSYARSRSDPLIADTEAFRCMSSQASRRVPAVAPMASGNRAPVPAGRVSAISAISAISAADYDCYDLPDKDCVVNGRFGVRSSAMLDSGRRQWGARVREAVLGDNASVFYFFSRDNPEVLVKVVDGCWMNGHYWVFGSAATDLEYRVTVEDLGDRRRHTYVRDSSNPLIADTTAFRCEL